MEGEESTRTLSLSSAISTWSVPAISSEAEAPAVKVNLQRRASQGSMQAMQSPVSRFLSKDKPQTWQLPSFASLKAWGPPSHNAPHGSSPTEQRLSPHASRVVRSGRLPTLDTTSDHAHGEYASSLPLTPPADDEEDHERWNTQASVVNVREPKPQSNMDEGRPRQSSSPSELGAEGNDRRGKVPAGDVQMSGLGLQDEQPSGAWLADSIDATRKTEPSSAGGGLSVG